MPLLVQPFDTLFAFCVCVGSSFKRSYFLFALNQAASPCTLVHKLLFLQPFAQPFGQELLQWRTMQALWAAVSPEKKKAKVAEIELTDDDSEMEEE